MWELRTHRLHIICKINTKLRLIRARSNVDLPLPRWIEHPHSINSCVIVLITAMSLMFLVLSMLSADSSSRRLHCRLPAAYQQQVQGTISCTSYLLCFPFWYSLGKLKSVHQRRLVQWKWRTSNGGGLQTAPNDMYHPRGGNPNQICVLQTKRAVLRLLYNLEVIATHSS